MITLLAAAFLATSLAFAESSPESPVPPGETAQPAASAPKPRTWVRAWGGRALRVLAALVICAFLLLLLENRLIFFPSRYPEGDWALPRERVEDCFFETSDGVKLHAWWLPATQPDGAPVLLWFHGNAGNITNRAHNLSLLAERDVGVLLVDYRGYGKSEGRPTEAGVYLDGLAAYDYLTRERGVAPNQIICFGRSLGTPVALHVALERPVAGLVLESPFKNAKAMAKRVMPIVPIWPFIRSKFDNVGRVPGVSVPVLVMHGDRDEIVPFEQGQAVFEAAPEPKEFYRLEGAGHNDTYLVGGEPYFQKLMGFCRGCVKDDALRE